MNLFWFKIKTSIIQTIQSKWINNLFVNELLISDFNSISSLLEHKFSYRFVSQTKP